MGTKLSEAGFRVVIYSNDHEPAHVHVIKAEGEVKINLLDTTSFQVWNMSDRDVKVTRKLVESNKEFLLAEWIKMHGS